MTRFTLSHIAPTVLGTALLAPFAVAGEPALSILFVTDPDLDRVFQMNDAAGDGSYNEPGDTFVMYDDTLGTIALGDPSCITISTDDTIYVGDTTEDRILALNDFDEDLDCHDAGEHWTYVDASNASGVSVSKITGLSTRLLGTVWATNQGSGIGGDSILRLRDSNADGDANDANEAHVFFAPAPGGAEGDSRPTSLVVEKSGAVYYLENGSTGVLAKGVYQLIDLDFDGVIDAPGEVAAYFVPSAQALPADLTSVDIDGNGFVFVNDRANRIVWRGFDADADGSIHPITEAAIFVSNAPSSDMRDFAVADNGSIYLGESQSPDRVLRGFDLDLNDVIDAIEKTDAYSDALSPENVDDPAGVARDFHDHQFVGVAYCFGDSGLCPCNNHGTPETGCANSVGQGALLEAEGSDGVGNDDAEFTAEGLPPFVFCILFQGTADVNFGFGLPFFDGLNCIGGSLTRLGTRFADVTGSATWGPGLATGGGWIAGETRYFQARYRNALGPCGFGANTTSGLMITFTP